MWLYRIGATPRLFFVGGEVGVHGGPALLLKLLKKEYDPYYGPLGLSNCMIWLDGSYGVETSGGLVTSWKNKSTGRYSGGYVTQPNASYRPEYDAVNKCVYFNGTNKGLAGDASFLKRFNYPDVPRYLYCVFSIDNLSANRMIINSGRAGGYPPPFHMVNTYMETSARLTCSHHIVQAYGVGRQSYVYDNTSYTAGTKALSAQRSLFVGGSGGTYYAYNRLSNEPEQQGNTGGEGTWDYSKPPATGPGFGATYFIVGCNSNWEIGMQGKIYELVLFCSDQQYEHDNLREYFRSKYSLW